MALSIVDVFSLIGTAASVASFMQQNFRNTDEGRTFSRAELVHFISSGRISGIDFQDMSKSRIDQVAGLAVRLMIDRDLLDALLEKVASCKSSHLKGLREAVTSDQRHAVHRSAKRCICDLLQEIKDFNKGKIPGFLMDTWKSYGCVSSA